MTPNQPPTLASQSTAELPKLPPVFYAIYRMRNRVASTSILHYTTLKEAAAFMRSNGLVKVGEKHFPSHGLVQWEVQ